MQIEEDNILTGRKRESLVYVVHSVFHVLDNVHFSMFPCSRIGNHNLVLGRKVGDNQPELFIFHLDHFSTPVCL